MKTEWEKFFLEKLDLDRILRDTFQPLDFPKIEIPEKGSMSSFTQGEIQSILDAKKELHRKAAAYDKLMELHTLEEYHEDDGPVVWWKFPIEEPSYIGSPLYNDWPGYHTHWTRHPDIPEIIPKI